MIIIELPTKEDVDELCHTDGLTLMGEMLASMAIDPDESSVVWNLDQVLWGLEEPPAYTGRTFYDRFAKLVPLMSKPQLEVLKSEIECQHMPAVDCFYEGGRSVSISVFDTA